MSKTLRQILSQFGGWESIEFGWLPQAIDCEVEESWFCVGEKGNLFVSVGMGQAIMEFRLKGSNYPMALVVDDVEGKAWDNKYLVNHEHTYDARTPMRPSSRLKIVQTG